MSSSPFFPIGGSKTDLSSGPGSAYVGPGGVFVPQPIGQKPTPPNENKTIDQAAINQAISDSQQGQYVSINLPWLMAQPDSPSKTFLINLVASINAGIHGIAGGN